VSENNLPGEKSPLHTAAEDWWAKLPEAERAHWIASAEDLWGPGTATVEDAYLRYLAVGSIREVADQIRRGK
jgi:hypothetical protein